MCHMNESREDCWTCGNLKLLISCKIIFQPPYHHIKQDQILRNNMDLKQKSGWEKIVNDFMGHI